MNLFVTLLFATLSVWEYPERQGLHNQLKHDLVVAVQRSDTESRLRFCRRGVETFPDDPTWAYNLACSEAVAGHDEAALDSLARAIELGFREAQVIEGDRDFAALKETPRFQALVEQARLLKGVPLVTGPLAVDTLTVPAGTAVVLSDRNVSWNLEQGAFEAHLELTGVEGKGGNFGDLYFNRDHGHSQLALESFPGITPVKLEGRAGARDLDVNEPNMFFPQPVFGNCSRAFIDPVYWRSLPRALMTSAAGCLPLMVRFYLSNQVWVYPANEDYPPLGKCGDVFASQVPYFLVSAGRSWSDQCYLRAALEVSRSLEREVKAEIVKRRLLAPMVQVLLRKSLLAVTNEADYLTARAHPTALPANGINLTRLKRLAAELKVDALPPLVALRVGVEQLAEPPEVPELTYATPFAVAYVLRSPLPERTFMVEAQGAEEVAFAPVHGEGQVRIERKGPRQVQIWIDRAAMTVTNRVELMVCGRNPGTGWGAPSYVSFAVVDKSAPYSDPVLTR